MASKSIASPAGSPSRIVTRPCPCDSPDVKKRSIRRAFYTKKLRRPGGARARITRRSRRFARGPFVCTRRRGMLMLDRYLVAGGRALDLATGASIRWHVRRQRASPLPPLFTVRGRSWLIDFDRARPIAHRSVGAPRRAACTRTATRRCAPFAPRWPTRATAGRARSISMEPSAEQWRYIQRVLAREARLAGFVPMAADAFGAVLSQARWRWPSWLKDRSLVVFATDTRLSPDATLALFKLATKDARPAPRRSRRHERAVAAAARLGADARARGRAVRSGSSRRSR